MNSVAWVIRVLPASDANPALSESTSVEPKLDDAVDRQFVVCRGLAAPDATDRR